MKRKVPKPPCPKTGKKHKYTFIKNITVSRASTNSQGTSVSMKVVGLYKCECGERHHGAYNSNHEHDLRKLA